jgi:hypothetical protein
MHKRVSPAQAAKRVLQAFPYTHIGAEVSWNHIAEYFRRHYLPVSDMVAGVHYAVSSGWVERTDIQALKLTTSGVEALNGQYAPVPPSTWHSWAHP